MKLIKFFATWCGPCKQMAPVVDKFVELHPELEYVAIDVDKQEELAKEYAIKGLPTVVLEHDGKVITRLTGNIAEPFLFGKLEVAMEKIPQPDVNAGGCEL